jgi:hypothetical protein
MQVTVYWGNLFIFVCVLAVSWIATRLSTLEALGVSLTAFVAANVLENVCRFTGFSLKAREIQIVPRTAIRKTISKDAQDTTQDTHIDDRSN